MPYALPQAYQRRSLIRSLIDGNPINDPPAASQLSQKVTALVVRLYLYFATFGSGAPSTCQRCSSYGLCECSTTFPENEMIISPHLYSILGTTHKIVANFADSKPGCRLNISYTGPGIGPSSCERDEKCRGSQRCSGRINPSPFTLRAVSLVSLLRACRALEG